MKSAMPDCQEDAAPWKPLSRPAGLTIWSLALLLSASVMALVGYVAMWAIAQCAAAYTVWLGAPQ